MKVSKLVFIIIFLFFSYRVLSDVSILMEDCQIWDLIVDDHPCEDSVFYVYLDFEYENVGWEGFKVEVNGELFGNYEYEDLPLENIGPFLGDGVTYYEFVVTDLVYEDCNDWAEISTIDCYGGDCAIWNVETMALPCDDNGYFMVLLGFLYENVGDMGFRVDGNGNNYGNFEYGDLPIEIGPLAGDGITFYEFLVTDNQYEDCSGWSELGFVDCDTVPQFNNLSTQVSSCENCNYYLKINFNCENIGNEGFGILGNGENYGSFEYSDLPVTIGPLVTDGITSYYFVVRDQTYQNYGNWNRLIPFTCDNLSIDDVPDVSLHISIAPNPATESVIVTNHLSSHTFIIRFYNSSGKLVKAYKGKEKLIINSNEIGTGIFFYQIISGQQKTQGKLIIQ